MPDVEDEEDAGDPPPDEPQDDPPAPNRGRSRRYWQSADGKRVRRAPQVFHFSSFR